MHQIFQRILKTTNSKVYLQNFLNNNYNLVIKIIEKSTKNEINRMIENPSILIKPIEKYKLKNPKEKKKIRHKSQVYLSKKKMLNKRISFIDESDIRFTLNNKKDNESKLGKKNLIFSKSDKFNNILKDSRNKDSYVNENNTDTNYKYIDFPKNKHKQNLFINLNSKNNNHNDNDYDSYSSLNISI